MRLAVVTACSCAYASIQFLRLMTGDADLQLQWKERFGKSPAVMRDRVVWLVGASSGIGEALAYELSKAGCKLILSARRDDQLNRVKNNCVEQGYQKAENIYIAKVDVQAFDTHSEIVDRVIQKFGKIDILVLNSGVTQTALIENTEFAVNRQVMDVNYFGSVSITKAVLPQMIQQGCGHIIATSSVLGKIPTPPTGSYNAAKHAIQGWFGTLQYEVAKHNIDVSIICPGPIDTDIWKSVIKGKSGEIEDTTKTNPQKRMSSARCARLMAIAMANKMDEVWISQQPELSAYYLCQYAPSIAKFVFRKALVAAALKQFGEQ